MTADIDRARDALNSIPADLSRDEWHRVGRAGIAAGLSIDDLVDWSRNADNFKSEQDVRAAFNTITPEGGTGAGTLFKIAAEHGWRESNRTTAPTSKQATRKPLEPQRKPTPGMSAAEVWERCEAATSEHPYIVSKGAAGVPLENLRVLPAGDALHIAGEPMAGALVVPVNRADGSISSLQFIALPEVAARLKAQGKPGKLNLPGATLEGWHTVGEVVPGGVIHICEGLATAWACWQATGGAAVVCCGWGRVRTVAAELRARDASARLLICPDVGKEQDAEKIAQEVGAAVAYMPQGEANNFDASDLAARNGSDVLAELLEAASEPCKPEPHAPHLLAKFVSIDMQVKPPKWVIPGFIAEGLVAIAGSGGVGKTTALLPLAMVAAGLHGATTELAPREWRHVVYITEDVDQAMRIVTGITQHGNLGINPEQVRERLHIVSAVRLDPVYAVQAGVAYRQQFTRTVGAVDVLPLVVFDTKSAVFEQENENDNAQASRIVAALKQQFSDLPCWVIGHVAKANFGRPDATSMRGGGAFGDDAHQTMFLIQEKEDRYLIEGKVRFEPKWQELQIVSYCASVVAPDVFGNIETVNLRWGIAQPPVQGRKEAKQDSQEQAKKDDAANLRDEVRKVVDAAWAGRLPLNRKGVMGVVKGHRTQDVSSCIENLINEGWLHEVDVPAKERTNNKRSTFLVNFTTAEHEAFTCDGKLPEAKLVIPQSWKKAVIPSIPEPEQEISEIQETEGAS